MLITLGRNEPNGKYAVAVEDSNDKVFLRVYKQKDGMSNFKNVVAQIELNDRVVDEIVEYYKRLRS